MFHSLHSHVHCEKIQEKLVRHFREARVCSGPFEGEHFLKITFKSLLPIISFNGPLPHQKIAGIFPQLL